MYAFLPPVFLSADPSSSTALIIFWTSFLAVFAGMARFYNNTVGVDKSTVEEGSGRLPASLVKPAGEC